MIAKVDIKNNRLYLKFSGGVSRKQLDKLYTDVRFAVADLLPGFAVINDLTECTLCHISGIATYRKISKYLISSGVRDVVRIINNDSLVLKQFLNFASRFAEYIPVYVSTIQEAEEQLNKSDERNRLSFHFASRPSVDYSTNNANGEGHILNISARGCKISSTTFPPEIDQEIEIVITFNASETAQKTFSTKAYIIRIDDDGFAVEYSDLSKNRKEELWQDLLREFEHDSQTFPVDIIK
jgi:hypothetical protein